MATNKTFFNIGELTVLVRQGLADLSSASEASAVGSFTEEQFRRSLLATKTLGVLVSLAQAQQLTVISGHLEDIGKHLKDSIEVEGAGLVAIVEELRKLVALWGGAEQVPGAGAEKVLTEDEW